MKSTRAAAACCITALVLGLGACGGTGGGGSGGTGGGGSGGGGSGGNVATDCVRPIVDGPDTSGTTTISADLNGDWPEGAEIHASVTFEGSSGLQYFSEAGQRVSVSDDYGDAVTTAKVYITSSNASAISCNLWSVQP
jgi:hypothetical protein